MKVDTRDELYDFVQNVVAGESTVYHVGSLPHDRLGDTQLNDLANAALELSQDGYLKLFQRRRGDLDYEYIAVRTDYQDFLEIADADAVEEEENVE